MLSGPNNSAQYAQLYCQMPNVSFTWWELPPLNLILLFPFLFYFIKHYFLYLLLLCICIILKTFFVVYLFDVGSMWVVWVGWDCFSLKEKQVFRTMYLHGTFCTVLSFLKKIIIILRACWLNNPFIFIRFYQGNHIGRSIPTLCSF